MLLTITKTVINKKGLLINYQCWPKLFKLLTNFIQSSGNVAQSVLQRNLSQCNHPIGGFLIRPLSNAMPSDATSTSRVRPPNPTRLIVALLKNNTNYVYSVATAQVSSHRHLPKQESISLESTIYWKPVWAYYFTHSGHYK